VRLLVEYALTFVGKPYRWGGDDAIEGFDCSGLAQELLASVGMDPPGDQTAQGLYNYFEGRGERNVYLAGALAFYGDSVTKITHVAVLMDQYRVIEAGGGGSKTTSEAAAAAQNAYVRLRPVNHRDDLIAVIRPRYPMVWASHY
jgi:cell wall-associated NlpC family hydrolase